MPALTPRLRAAIYWTVAALALAYIVAYLILAVVEPDYAKRLLDAPAALVGIITGIVAMIAATHTDTRTTTGEPAAEYVARKVPAAIKASSADTALVQYGPDGIDVSPVEYGDPLRDCADN